MPAFQPIDSDAEHHRVLFELGLLDDMDDWPLYQAQEARFHALDDSITEAQWHSYRRRGMAPWLNGLAPVGHQPLHVSRNAHQGSIERGRRRVAR